MQITDHVHALKIPFQITDPSGQKIDRFVYAYLIYGQKIYLIDSGVASSEKIILDYLKATGRSPRRSPRSSSPTLTPIILAQPQPSNAFPAAPWPLMLRKRHG